jgi:hypothetical protein
MTTLTTKQISLPVIAQNAPFVKPLSYEFRIHETVKDNKITNVKLQVQVWEHDEYGVGMIKQIWSDVPRQQFDENGLPAA